MKGQDQIFSKGNDEWETNPQTFMALHDEFDFEVDVCASDSNALLPVYFTAKRSALKERWRIYFDGRRLTRYFMNPPYGDTAEHMRHAYAQATTHKLLVVCLVASRTDTRWWHDLVWDLEQHKCRPGVQVRFLKGREMFYENGQPRVNDKGQKQRAPFPSVVVIFDGR